MSASAPALNPFDAFLWDHADRLAAPETGLGNLAAHPDAPPAQIVVETVIADGNPPLLALRPRHVPTEIRALGTLGLMRVNDPRAPFLLAAWPTAHEGVFQLVTTIPTTDQRWRSVEKWVGGAAPSVVPCFLDHADYLVPGSVEALK